MKKTFLLVVSCLLFLLLSSAAFGAQGPYASGSLGIGFLRDSIVRETGFSGDAEFDSGAVLGLAVGYYIGNCRLEGEFGYQKNDVDKIGAFGVGFNASGDITSTSLLVNGYYDLLKYGALTPYVSLGLGLASLELNDLTVPGATTGSAGDDDMVFAYQVGAGVGYALNPQMTIDFKYRYFATQDPDFGGTKFEYGSHNFLLGLRYNF